MKTRTRFLGQSGLSLLMAIITFVASVSVAPSVRADDTEVFFPAVSVSSNSTVNPNILFIIDDSISMAQTDGLADSRLTRVQIAFRTLMDDINSNTNVGLMRFSDTKGGPVIFPVSGVEKLIKDIDPSFATITNQVQIAKGLASEAQQLGSVVKINQSPIYLGAIGTMDFTVDQEAEQTDSSGSNKTTCTTLSSPSASCNSTISAPLEMIKTNSDPTVTNSHQWLGLRFQQLPMPTDFVATDARLVFAENDPNGDTDPVDLKIWGNRNNAAPAFTGTPNFNVAASDASGTASYATPNGIPCGTLTTCTQASAARVPTNGTPTTSFSAPYSGAGSVNWLNVPSVDHYEQFASPNIKDLVNEIKNCKTVTLSNTLSAAVSSGNTFVLSGNTPLPAVGTVVTFTDNSLTRTVSVLNTGTRAVTVTAAITGSHPNGTTVTWPDPAVSVTNACTTDWQASPTTSQNVLTFMITGANASGKGRRQAVSLRTDSTPGPTGTAPRLQIAFTSASAPPPTVVTGLQFNNVQIPKGVTLTSAYINFNQDAIGGSGNLKLKVSIEDADNAAAYTTGASNITGRTYNATTAAWTVPAWSTSFGLQDTAAATGSALKDLINAVTSRTNWCGGNTLAFKIEVDSGSDAGAFRRAISSAMNGTAAPTLVYSYASDDTALATGCASGGSTAVQINTSADDGEERGIGGAYSDTSATLNLGCKGACTGTGATGTASIVGLRFPTVAIPPNAIIKTAVIDFVASANASGTASLNIYGEDSGDAPNLKAATLSSVRNTKVLTPTVPWTTSAGTGPLTNWTQNTKYTSPDLSAVVQKMVNNSGWASGHAMAFLIDGSGSRVAYPVDGSAASAPKLKITYQSTVGKLTVRNYLKILVGKLTPTSYTPSVGTLYEAARYYRGEGAFYGLTRGMGSTLASPVHSTNSVELKLNVSHPSTFAAPKPTRVPSDCSLSNPTSPNCADETYTGTTNYKSPITDSCQANSLVFLTDGLPNSNDATSKVKAMTGDASCRSVTISGTSGGGDCAEELTKYLFNKDQSSAFTGTQTVKTYTIGLNIPDATDWLTKVATLGGGAYYSANTADELAGVFQQIVSSVLDIPTTFVAPAVTVNTFNRLTNRNELYFAVFKPDTDVLWNGNLKKYRLYQATTDAAPKIYDGSTTPINAVDPTNGFFCNKTKSVAPCPVLPDAGVKSYWSATADYDDVAAGGAASNLNATVTSSPKKTFTYVDTAAPSNVDLTTTANKFDESNTAITSAMLGTTDANRTAVMQWARGIDLRDENHDGITTDARKSLGDPLHSEPALITYGGTTDATIDIAIYMGTNSDGLHGFNAKTGDEYFNFLPKEALANLGTYYNDTAGYTSRPYGVDGPITSWINDGGDGVISGTDTAYIYAGLRRGGRAYYALDVTTRTSPTLLFKIDGGNGDYIELGQTWSPAIHGRIKVNPSTTKDVLIFTGGYDPNVDSQGSLGVQADSQGRALYVADAKTGALIWWGGFDVTSRSVHPNLSVSQMIYSVPAAPKAVDLDGDGNVDRIYIADAGGQIFRFVVGGQTPGGVASLKKADGTTNNVSVQYIASLSGTTDTSAHRFFATPDVALITANTPTPYLSLAIGSGFREHPLNTNNEDRFYVLRDPDVNNTSNTVGNITTTTTTAYIDGDSDLYNATSNYVAVVCASGDTTCAANKAAANAALGTPKTTGNKKGFYIKLLTPNADTTKPDVLKGEKVISSAITFNNQILFVSFEPGKPSGTCTAAQGFSRFYQIDVTNGTPVMALTSADGTTTLVRADRSKTLKQGGLPPDPTLLFPSISSTVATDSSGNIIKDSNGKTTYNVTTGSTALPNQGLLCIGSECFQSSLKIPTLKNSWQKIEN